MAETFPDQMLPKPESFRSPLTEEEQNTLRALSQKRVSLLEQGEVLPNIEADKRLALLEKDVRARLAYAIKMEDTGRDHQEKRLADLLAERKRLRKLMTPTPQTSGHGVVGEFTRRASRGPGSTKDRK